MRIALFDRKPSLRRLFRNGFKSIAVGIGRRPQYSKGYGKVFYDTYQFLQKSQYWRRSWLEAYQMQQLQNLLHHAYRYVPYYTRILDERGLKPSDIQSPDDLKKLPAMTKDDFRNNFEELVATNRDNVKIPLGHTSGTSGKALQFYTSWEIIEKELAFVLHQWSRVDFKPGELRVEVRGPVIEAPGRFIFDSVYNVLRLSPRIDDQQTARYYIDKIAESSARFVYGYPSAIACLAQYVKRCGIKVPFALKAVMFASEVIYAWQRDIVREVFKCRVFSHYGLSEQAVTAAECEHAEHYHCVPQYGITEFDPQSGEIIGTSLLNDINPFIRYRTTDIAQHIRTDCDQCRRAYYPVFKKIEGRIGDYLVTSRGLVGPGIMIHPFKDLKTIRDTQITQISADLIELKAACWPDKKPLQYADEIEFLKQQLHDILGADMRIEVQEVAQIERQDSGKFKWIASNVSGDLIEKGFGIT